MLSILVPARSETYIQLFMNELEEILPVHEIVVCNDRESRGKGWALREAFMQSRGDIVAFIDGDGDIPPRMLRLLLVTMEELDCDVVVGSKRITKAPLRRKVMTHVTRWWFKILFGVRCDTQTGIKLFKRKALEGNLWICDSFVFDVELICNIQSSGYEIVEVPIKCEIKKQLAFKTIWRIFWGSVLLCLKIRVPFLKNAKFAI